MNDDDDDDDDTNNSTKSFWFRICRLGLTQLDLVFGCTLQDLDQTIS